MEKASDAEFTWAITIFESLDSSDEDVWKCFDAVFPIVARQKDDELKVAFEWWMRLYLSVRLACSREEIKAFILESVSNEAYFVLSAYPIVEGAMKAVIHCMWRRLATVMAKDKPGKIDIQKGKQCYCALIDDLQANELTEVDIIDNAEKNTEMPSRGMNHMVAMKHLLRKSSPRS